MGRSFFITRQWRIPPVMVALMCVEFLLTIGCLTLYGIADPNTYRTKLWQNGYDIGANSAPNSILYAYANYRPVHTPIVWSSYLVQFNIAIAVLSMFILLVKSTMFVLHTWIPLLSALVSALEVGLYAASLSNQTKKDTIDPDHQQKGLPWYLSKGCSYATPGNYGYCMQARAVFAITCVMIALFSTYLIWSVYSMLPTAAERAERQSVKHADIEMKKVNEYSPDSELSREEIRERNRQMFLNLPKTPNTPGFGARGLNPMTPRTVAFTQLNGGEPTPAAGKATGPLKFREQYGGQARGPDGR